MDIDTTQTPVQTPPPGAEDVSDMSVDQILNELEKEADNPDVPSEVAALDQGNKDAQGKASHAFAEQKRKQKQLVQVVRAQQDELLRLKTQTATPPPPPATPDQMVSVAKTVLANLRARACSSLGLSNPDQAPELVQMEMQRLYSEEIAATNRRAEAQRNAPAVVREVLSGFPDNVTEADRVEITKRVSRSDVTQQVDPQYIQAVAAQYLGEKLLRGDVIPQPTANTGAAPMSSGAVRVVGSRGVRPPDRQATVPVTPPTAEEAQKMRKLGFTDVRVLRAAEAKKSQYKSQ